MARNKTTLPTETVDDALDVVTTPAEVIPPVVDDQGDEIPTELQFTTPAADPAAEEVGDDDILEFSVDGNLLVAIKPNPEQWGVLMTLLAKSATMADRFHAMQTFGSHVLDEPSFLYVQSRLLDRTDPFGTEMYAHIIETLITKFTPQREPGNRAARRAHARAARR